MDVLSREYRLLYVEQKEIVKEQLIAVVVDSLDSLSEVVCAQLQCIAESNAQTTAPTGTQANQELVQAQNVVQEAGRVYGQQLASTLTQGLNSLNILPSVAGSIASNQPTADAVSISGTQPQVNTSTNQINDANEDSDDEDMSVKSEINSDDECLSDSDSQPDVEVKEEPDETQTETEINQTGDTATVKDEIVSSSESESDTDSDEYESDTVQVKEEDQEENEVQSMDNSSNQDSVPDDSPNEESENNAQSDGNIETVDSNECNHEHQSDGMLMDDETGTEASNEQDQAGPPIVSNTASTLTRRSTRASARTVNYAEAVENSATDVQKDNLTGTRKRKRSNGRSRKSTAHKRTRVRVSKAQTVAAEGADESEDEVDPETEAISFRIIVRRLKCHVPGCKKVFPDKVQLDGHLLTKHAIEKYACKVKDCTESYATMDELTIHRNSTHDNQDNEWPCGQCDVTCNNYNDLRTHTYQYHEHGLFACSADKCDFTEKTRSKVMNHQLKHRPAKYRCTYAGCLSSFNKKSHLTTHSRVHSKEKPFLCSQCPKAFAVKCDLTRHERVHSGLKPYSCTWPHCDYSASRQSTVIAHIRGVHFGLPQSKTEQAKRGIIDNRDARLFLKTTTTSTGN